MADAPNANPTQSPTGTQQPNADGTSRAPVNDKQQNTQMLNPDPENARNAAAAPGVVPTERNVIDKGAPPSVEDATAGQEPEPKTSVRKGDQKTWYTIGRGKHRYQDEDGEWQTAVAGTNNDRVLLTRTQYDKLGDRFSLKPSN